MLRFQKVSDRGSSWFCGGTGTANPSTGKVKENIAATFFSHMLAKMHSKHVFLTMSLAISENFMIHRECDPYQITKIKIHRE